MTFEDPTQMFKCSRSDCEADRAGGTPLCARHLRAQELLAGATSISEPELEAKVALVRTEDDDHPGEKKVYDRETGEPSWVPDVPDQYVGPDPDVNGMMATTDAIIREVSGNIPPAPHFNPDVMEPHWDGAQWVLRRRRKDVDLNAVRSAVRDLMSYLGIHEAEDVD